MSPTHPVVLATAGIVYAPIALDILNNGWALGIEHGIKYAFSPVMIASYIYLFVVLRVTHSGKTIKLSSADNTAALWFLVNGVYYNLFLDVVSGQFQMNGLMTEQYNILEPRYKLGPMVVSGQSVFWTSIGELFFHSPLSILTYYAYHRGKSWRRPLEIIVGMCQIAGVWWFYVPEAYSNFPHLGGWPKPGEHFTFYRLFYFYMGFWFFAILWVASFGYIIFKAFQDISAIIANHDAKKAS